MYKGCVRECVCEGVCTKVCEKRECVQRCSVYKGVVCLQVVCREGVSKGCVWACV